MDKLWLDHFNFRFDPFEHGEASRDPNLNRYLIGHEAFSVAWSETPAMIYSPPGGGKTALRIYTARACWTGGGGYQPFPIHYHLPHYFKNGDFSTVEDHLEQIVHSGAHALFLAFAYYPLIFIRSAPSLQKQLAQFIFTWIPKIDFYLDVLREGKPDEVAGQLDGSYKLYQTPDPTLLALLLEILAKYHREDPLPVSLSIQKIFERMVHWITGDLGFRAVYLLLDGVDGFPELASSPGFAAQSLAQLFAKAPKWTASHIFVKGFLPQEIRAHLREQLEDRWTAFDQIDLKWDAAILADMLRRRTYVATEGEFASLSAVSALPSNQDLELELARVVNPLPREALTLVRQVLFEYETRWGRNPTAAKQIRIEDMEKALAWYRNDQAHITKELASIAQG
ncbi:MAG: hypothetical protein HND45_13550 [Chloroflexi bacterium]|nr:hypothetical protein [Chloroflexota bacterium]NOG76908.1 hypothetical protein [Chloroflexota bacterium]WKZ50545.1 MAG: hypothetical protein QY329_13885 [Anaerolineales bacterium]HPP61896.1 hypothetical protein [Anaerolineales bacterium]